MNTIEEVTIYKNLELSLRREVWRLDLSPLNISLGRLFPTVTVREESMLVPQICVYETWSFRMWVPVWGGWRLGCQQGWELSNAEWWLGPSHDDPLEVPMWMEGHKPLLFPILYHILKFISVSLGTDLSRGSHLWIVWCVMGVFVEADRWSTQGTTSVRAQFLVCYARSHRLGTWWFPFKTNSFIPVLEKRSDSSRGTAIDADS